MKPLHQVFNEAADLIEKRGLAKGDYCVNGRLCMLGAISTACTGWPDPNKGIYHPEDVTNRKAQAFLRDAVFCGHTVGDENDAPGFRKRDAVAALRIAADLATPKP